MMIKHFNSTKEKNHTHIEIKHTHIQMNLFFDFILFSMSRTSSNMTDIYYLYRTRNMKNFVVINSYNILNRRTMIIVTRMDDQVDDMLDIAEADIDALLV